MFIVDLQSKTPIFEQLKKQILEFISIGILLPNDKLPSVRSLASQIGVNPNTVAKAYQELENQGYVYSVKGKGCFVADNETDQLIKDEKLHYFQTVVEEMKKHQISKKQLTDLVNMIYKEEEQ
ncbi:GntR family transcriptional regulator [[Clostridium] spiroforme]|nr:GntR family transcriptional regulator [Thomasclavelia spiroformis]MBM6879593.1 GntR family transcriptional regulator [Thomasclavelia spiroformis]